MQNINADVGHYILSDKPMTDEQWIAERATIESKRKLISGDRDAGRYSQSVGLIGDPVSSGAKSVGQLSAQVVLFLCRAPSDAARIRILARSYLGLLLLWATLDALAQTHHGRSQG